jgi:hypothetical protein
MVSETDSCGFDQRLFPTTKRFFDVTHYSEMFLLAQQETRIFRINQKIISNKEKIRFG